MIFVRLPHDERPDLRVLMVADAEDGPAIEYFYLEKLVGKTWVRSRKIGSEWFERYMDRLKFDIIEARFLMEEAAEKEEY